MNILSKCLFLIAGLAVDSALAQADFIFNKYSPGVGLDAPVYDADGNRLFGTNYVAELYGGITADSMVLLKVALPRWNRFHLLAFAITRRGTLPA
jgi:hypothetical protein